MLPVIFTSEKPLISVRPPFNLTLKVSTLAGFIRDSSPAANPNNGTSNFTLNSYVNDSIIGSVLSASLNANTNNLTIIFNETINTSQFDLSRVYLHNGPNYSTSGVKGNLSLVGATYSNNGTVVYGSSTFEIYLILTTSQIQTICNNGWGGAYVAWDNATARDLAGNYIAVNVSNETGQYVTLSSETSAPYWASNNTNMTSSTPNGSDVIQMNITLNDNMGLSNYYFMWNNTGSWANITIGNVSGTQILIQENRTLTPRHNQTIGWRVMFNDTSNNWNVSTIFTFVAKNMSAYNDPLFPYWTGSNTNETSSTPDGAQVIQMNITLNDDTGLSNYYFMWNNTGSWANITIGNVSGTQILIQENRTLTPRHNQTIGWRVMFNDTSNKWNVSEVFTFVAKNMSVPAGPFLTNASYSYISNVLSLFFSEPVNASTIVMSKLQISGGAAKTLNLNTYTITSNSSSTNTTNLNLTLSAEQKDIISAFRVSTLSVSTLAGFIKANNSAIFNNGTFNTTLDGYVNDSTIGSIINATFNAATRNLTIIFSETINTSELNTSKIFLHTGSNYSTSGVKGNLSLAPAVYVSNGTVVYGDDSFEIYFNLSDTQMATLGNQSWSTMYVAMSNDTARDLAGNYIARNVSNQTAQYVAFTPETTAPTVSAIAVKTNLSKTGGTINISVTADDFNRVQNVTVAGQKLISNAARNYFTGMVYVNTSSSGTLSVVSKDVFGNSVTNSTITITVDNTGITTTAYLNKTSDGKTADTTGASWTNKNVTVNFTTSGNNLSYIFYRNGTNGDWGNITKNNINFTTNVTGISNPSGQIIQFRSSDTMGNYEAYQTKYIKIDQDAPAISSITLSSTNLSNSAAGSIIVAASISDALSGLNSSTLVAYHDGPTGSNETSQVSLVYTNGKYTGTLTAPTRLGGYNLMVNATDNAGNKQTNSALFSVVNATSNFSISSNVANNTYVANGTSITFTLTNVTSVWYNATHAGNFSFGNASGATITYSVIFKGDNTNITVFGFDSGTNLVTNTTYKYLGDFINPSSISLTGFTSGQKVNGTITLTAAATDSESGIANVSFYTGASLRTTDTTSPYTYDWNTLPEYGQPGNYSINVTVRDAVGNENFILWYAIINNTYPSSVTVTNGVADFAGTQISSHLVQIMGGLNESTTASASISETEIGSASGVGTVFLSMNITASSNEVGTIVKFKLPKTTSGLSGNLNSLYAFATHSDGTTETLTVTYDSANDDADYYAFYFTTTKFSVFTIATAAATTITNTGGSGGGGGSTAKTVDVSLVVSGTDVSLAKNDKAKIISNLGVHYLTATAVSSTDATITLVSESATMKIGDVAEKDLNGDGKNDIKITLTTIISGKATFNLKKISNVVAYDSGAPSAQPSTQPPSEQREQTPPRAGEQPPTQAGEQPGVGVPAEGKTTGSFLSSPILIISLIVLLAIIIVGIVIAKARR